MNTGFNYRIISNQMQGCILETTLKKKFKKALNVFLIIAIGIILTLSVIALTKWLTFDTVYTQGITDTMRAKNGQKVKPVYAGIGGEGRVMKSEEK
jgi:hypothetical protein